MVQGSEGGVKYIISQDHSMKAVSVIAFLGLAYILSLPAGRSGLVVQAGSRWREGLREGGKTALWLVSADACLAE